MGLVYIYLVAWVLGGVLLGSAMLLDHGPAVSIDREGDEPSGTPRRAGSIASLGTFALIGFGLFGLAAEGLELCAAPWTALVALGGGTLLAFCGYAMRSGSKHTPEAQ